MVLYHHLPFKIWELGTAIYLLSILFTPLSWGMTLFLWLSLSAVIVCLRLPACRHRLTQIAFQHAKRSIVPLSKTEEQALNIGDTWFEKSLFQGQPDWDKLFKTRTTLTPAEQSFLDNETETLCQLLNEWEITQQHDLSPETWRHIKEKGFLGLIIDKKFGGKGFSARAHADIVLKIASRCCAAAVSIMVPNSLGPGELLQHYGTEEQQNHYLPRLANGELIPCFALTEPGAGSDATSIESEAIVFEKTLKGQTALYLSITLNKRWITLAPIANLIGVAVNLKDPNNLLNGLGEEGITCILIERDTPNLHIGNRHIPARQAFMNGTVRGQNVIVPITQIIGGQKNAGEGWKMLVECLSIGRAISLPAIATASSSVAYIASSAYARIRRQFNQELLDLEGIQEKLAEIGGLHYLTYATRLLTLSAVNAHLRPSVSSAITKYFNTETARICLNHAMDIHAGRAIMAGPRNYLLDFYQGIPISITVEGANILTRNLLIFGQGAMACHPYLRDELNAIHSDDCARFNTVLWQHIRNHLALFSKAFCSAWTHGFLIFTPKHPLKRACQKLTLLSYQFAFLADLSLILLGGQLKKKERLSARMADALCYLYAAMAVLHDVHQRKDADPQFLHAKWATDFAYHQAQNAMIAFCQNFPFRPLNRLIQFLIFPFGRNLKRPSDFTDKALARYMSQNQPHRDHIKTTIALSDEPRTQLEQTEATFQTLQQWGHLYRKFSDLKRFKYGTLKAKLTEKVKEGALTPEEQAQLVLMEKMRWDAEQVDEYALDFPAAPLLHSIISQYPNPVDEN